MESSHDAECRDSSSYRFVGGGFGGIEVEEAVTRFYQIRCVEAKAGHCHDNRSARPETVSIAMNSGKYLNIQDVIDLGTTLIKTADLYPMQFVTEKDFFPLVVAYLTGRVPALETEVATKDGRIDFQLKGTNPTWLELAVQPRHFVDKNAPDLRLPGYTRVSLPASQNRRELQKLMNAPTGKTRYLLLVDLNGGYKRATLIKQYKAEAAKITQGKTVRVVYVSRKDPFHFKAAALP